MEWFEIDDIRSTDFNIGVMQIGNERHQYFGTPQKDIVSEKIAGLNGQRVFEETYGIKTIQLTCTLLDNTDQTLIRDFNAWLGRTGKHTLVLSRSQWKQYRNVRLSSEITLDNYGKGSIFQVTFESYSALAFSNFTTQGIDILKYDMGYLYDSGLVYDGMDYTFTGADLPNLDIYHGGTSDSATPVFTINGSGTDISVIKYTDSTRTQIDKVMAYGSFSGELVFDTNRKNVFLNGNVNNTTFTGDYFTLDGRNIINLNNRGNIQSVINQAEITLESTASSIDDFYNNRHIYIRNPNVIESYYRAIITDYNGTTKVATLDILIPLNATGYEYAIYNETDGVNYISITGTGLNITSVDVDFRYVYI